MIKRLADRILRAPAPADGGTVVADPNETDPSAMSGWMSDLPSIETNSPLQPGTPAAPPKNEPDGKPAEKPAGTGNAGLPGGVKPGDAPNPKPADAPAGVKVADEPPKPAAPVKPDEKKADEGGEENAEAIAKDLEKEKFPRTGTQWDDYKTKYGDRLNKLETRLKGELEGKESRVKELEDKVKTFEERIATTGEDSPEVKAAIEKLTKERDEYSNRLQVLDVTQHPKFQAYFESKVGAQKELAKRIVGEEKAAAMDKILSLPDGEYRNQQLEEFISDLSQLTANRIGGILNNLEAISQERSAEIAKAKEHTTTLTTQQQEKQKASAEFRDKLVKSTVAGLQSEKDGMALFQKRAGDEAWNKAVESTLTRGKQLLTGEGVQQADVVKAAFHAAAFPRLLESYQHALQAHAEEMSRLEAKYEAQVKALSAAQPGAGSSANGGAGDSGGHKTDVRIGQTPGEAMSAVVKGLWDEGQ